MGILYVSLGIYVVLGILYVALSINVVMGILYVSLGIYDDILITAYIPRDTYNIPITT
jgi:hypothetical protein